MKNHTLYVNPVQGISVQGRHTRTYKTFDPVTGEEVNRSPINQSRGSKVHDQYKFKADYAKRRLITGLDVLIENPFKGKKATELQVEYGLSKLWDSLLESLVIEDKISKQREFEVKDGVDPDFYTSEMKGATLMDAGKGTERDAEAPTFLQKFKIVLYPRTNRFSSDSPRGRLSMQLIKNHNRIASSLDDINPTSHRFFISEENEATERRVKRREKITEAAYNYETLKRKFEALDRYKAAIVLKDNNGINILKGRATDDKVKEVLLEYISSTNRHQLSNGERLTALVERMGIAEESYKIDIEYLIQQALNGNVITARDGRYTWHSQIQDPNVGEFTSSLTFKNFILSEYEKYSPKSKSQNWYKILFDEVKSKDIWIE